MRSDLTTKSTKLMRCCGADPRDSTERRNKSPWEQPGAARSSALLARADPKSRELHGRGGIGYPRIHWSIHWSIITVLLQWAFGGYTGLPHFQTHLNVWVYLFVYLSIYLFYLSIIIIYLFVYLFTYLYNLFTYLFIYAFIIFFLLWDIIYTYIYISYYILYYKYIQ